MREREVSAMIKWLLSHFRVQNGMYFDKEYQYKQNHYFCSDIIDDSIWNYGFMETISIENLLEFNKFCNSIKRRTSLYIPSSSTEIKDESLLQEIGYEAPRNESGGLITESWMKFSGKRYSLPADYDVVSVRTEKQARDFISVFLAAYGGEKTPEKPYGELSPAYLKALTRTFGVQKFHHFVCYNQDVPVAVATLCFYEGQGGLYNVGTDPRFEKKGYGLAVSNACINKWMELGGEELFLQTETGTGIDDWYGRMGFEVIFYGAVYELK